MNEQTTWSPSFTRDTPGPTFSMIPAPSCPPTIGKRGTMSPWRRCSSEWQNRAATKRISTSWSEGSSRSSSVTSQSRPSSHRTAALVFTTLLLRRRGAIVSLVVFPSQARERLERRLRDAAAGHHAAVPRGMGRAVDQLVLEQLLDPGIPAGELVGLGEPGGA